MAWGEVVIIVRLAAALYSAEKVLISSLLDTHNNRFCDPAVHLGTLNAAAATNMALVLMWMGRYA